MKKLFALLLVLVLTTSCVAVFAETYDHVLKKGMKDSTDEADFPDNENDIRYMQQRLAYYEYYTGKLDGSFGSAMYKAVVAFQRKNGLKVDGRIGANTWAALASDTAIKKSAVTFERIESGDSGQRVTDLQSKLRQYYYYSGTLTGTFDTKTVNAVKAFQTSAGLTADGIVGEKTYNTLFSSMPSAATNGGVPRRTLKSGMRGYDVYVLQQKLISLNYLSSGAITNGYYDSAVTSAVKLFQKENSISQTGALDSTTRRYLWASAVDKHETDADAEKGSEDDPYIRPTLRLGSHGRYVSQAQMRLKAGGYLVGNADGVFGKATYNAVKALQTAKGIKADGVIGARTWNYIMAIDVSNADQTVVDNNDTSTGTSTTKLKLGSWGSAVKKLQQQLIQLGYLKSGDDDGKFGKTTRQAVITFQKKEGLKQDGIVGSETFARIYYRLGIN
ncbi:MAG: peptidoglycan-binding protein [Clostridia bacterium]|nr:peptidoglycan-binding protein [Clostridia bacterium]